MALRLQRLGPGRGGRLLAWVLDRTEVQELQRRLERSEKLSAMAIVAGKVAHEIRSPLNSIFLNSDLLQERVRRTRGPQAERLRHYCHVLEEEVERLNEIVGSYLALARLSGGERQETHVEEFLRTTRSLAFKHTAVEIQCPPSPAIKATDREHSREKGEGETRRPAATR